MASTGQTSMQARQSVQRDSMTIGRPGARRNAPSGHVARHSPHAVQRRSMTIIGRSRLASEHPFPADLHDCWAATEWLIDNAKQLGLDPRQIAIGGNSAGGNLAAVTALRARDEGIDLACQFLLYPAIDAQLDTESARRLSDGYGLSTTEMRYFWSQYLGSAAEASDRKASPLRAISLAGVAPTVIVTAEYDILRDEAEQYAARLLSEGVPVTSWRARGMPHAFLNYRAVSSGAAATCEVCAELLARAIGLPRKTR